MTAAELLRIVVAANGVALAVQSLRVIAVYSAVYSLSPNNWRRQLPLHVWLMALSFFIYVTITTILLFVNGEYLLTRGLVYGTAGGIAQYALWNVLKYDRRRYSKVTNFKDPDTPEPFHVS